METNADKFFEFDHESKVLPNENSIIQIDNQQATVPQVQPTQSLSMGSPVSPNQGTSIKASQEFDDVVSSAKAVDGRLAELLTQNKNAVQMIFPSKMQRLIAEKERLMVGSALEFRLNLLKLGNQFRLEAMRDKYDVYLKCYKGQNRLDLTQFMIQKLNELYRIVKHEELQTFRELEGMYANAATLAVPSMKQKYIHHIQNREGRLMDTIEKLIMKFESIIDENLVY